MPLTQLSYMSLYFSSNSNSEYLFKQLMSFADSATDISERFTLVTSSQNWDTAQTSCRKLYTDLAKVQNLLENEQLQRMVNGEQAWIGLTGLFWLWSDGSEPSFMPWKPLEPLLGGVFECTALDFGDVTFGLLDADCNAQLPFFCYKGKRLFPSMTPTDIYP